jgi:hypothetical protein
MIRKGLQSGKGRRVVGIAVGVGIFYALFHYWDLIAAVKIKPLDAGQKIAFVAAAFSVTAYNLRTRVIDLIVKFEASPSRIAELCATARECGRRLTNLVVLFTASAFLMGGGGFVPDSHEAAKWYACFSTALFGASVVQFLYVLFAFEKLERFMLDDAERRAAEKETKRLLGT